MMYGNNANDDKPKAINITPNIIRRTAVTNVQEHLRILLSIFDQ